MICHGKWQSPNSLDHLIWFKCITCGTHFGDTKLVASTTDKPAATNLCISCIFTDVGTLPFSFCRPSRGPTSTIFTKLGRSHITWRQIISREKNWDRLLIEWIKRKCIVMPILWSLYFSNSHGKLATPIALYSCRLEYCDQVNERILNRSEYQLSPNRGIETTFRGRSLSSTDESAWRHCWCHAWESAWKTIGAPPLQELLYLRANS